MKKLFGTDGIRGRANSYPMTGEVAFSLGRAVTCYFQKSEQVHPLIIIGKDTRLSCYTLEQAFTAGVCSQGGRAILTGPLPTPGVAFVTSSMRAQAGVMISASHNEFFDNGIKIFDASGHKLPDSAEVDLEEMVLNSVTIPVKYDADLGSAQRLDEVIGRYIVHVKSAFDKRYMLDNLRVVVDCANGAAYKIAPMIFSELGADVIPLGVAPNGQNINSDCGSMHPEYCAENVLKYRADIGICLDGDADRAVIIDNLGKVVDGDKIIGMCATLLKEVGELKKGHEVVGTVMSNLGLENHLRDMDISLARTKVGDRYIVEHMRKSGAIFGGEPSGHIIFKNYSTTGDGILSALKVIECFKFFDRPLSELVETVNLFPQIIKNVKVTNKPKFDTIPAIVKVIDDTEKKLGDSGRVLLRYSGTENCARIMIEGQDSVQIEKLSEEVQTVVQHELN